MYACEYNLKDTRIAYRVHAYFDRGESKMRLIGDLFDSHLNARRARAHMRGGGAQCSAVERSVSPLLVQKTPKILSDHNRALSLRFQARARTGIGAQTVSTTQDEPRKVPTATASSTNKAAPSLSLKKIREKIMENKK